MPCPITNLKKEDLETKECPCKYIPIVILLAISIYGIRQWKNSQSQQ